MTYFGEQQLKGEAKGKEIGFSLFLLDELNFSITRNTALHVMTRRNTKHIASFRESDAFYDPPQGIGLQRRSADSLAQCFPLHKTVECFGIPVGGTPTDMK